MKKYIGYIIIGVSIIIGAVIISFNSSKSNNADAKKHCYGKYFQYYKEVLTKNNKKNRTDKEIEALSSSYAMEDCNIK